MASRNGGINFEKWENENSFSHFLIESKFFGGLFLCIYAKSMSRIPFGNAMIQPLAGLTI